MTDREILLDLLPGCTPDKGARTFAATRLPGGAWMFVTGGLVQCSDLGLHFAKADDARKAIADHFGAWCDLVHGPMRDVVADAAEASPGALYQFAGAGPERPAPMTLDEVRAANPDARELLRMLALSPVGWTVLLPDGSSWTRVEVA